MKKSLVGMSLIAAVIMGAGLYLAYRSSQHLAQKASSPNPSAATISLTDNGFEPQSITVKQGETLTFINNGKDDHWPASNNHPTHQIYPQFDPKRPIAPGQSWSFTFDKVGSWGMHDHLFPSVTGIVTVQ